MASISEELKATSFPSEQIKAKVNIMFTGHILLNRVNSFLKPLDLTHEQFNVLRILRSNHPDKICQKDILARMITPQSNLTHILRRMKEKEFVHINRSQVDRRKHLVSMTQKGSKVLRDFDEMTPQLFRTDDGLSDSEARELNFLIDKFRTLIQKDTGVSSTQKTEHA